MSKRKIAKNTRPVKGKKPQKTVSAPRYAIKKDSLGRRYATDKRTGHRVPIAKADKERARRRKAAAEAREQLFRGIPKRKPVKAAPPPKVKASKKSRSKASKKGWETRRRNQYLKEEREAIQHEIKLPGPGEFFAPLSTEGVAMHNLNGIAERSKTYPKIRLAAEIGWVKLMRDTLDRQISEMEGLKPEPPPTPRFDRRFGEGMGDFVRSHFFAHANSLADIDDMVEQLADDPDYDFDVRELYTLYFSPEVA